MAAPMTSMMTIEVRTENYKKLIVVCSSNSSDRVIVNDQIEVDDKGNSYNVSIVYNVTDENMY
ncbi:conserved hypothetical protein [Ricinus communis]|uniref:Uncharacterized protein n=1 Tax=Ricinus communis TaxID=3988 RepID=B9SIU9_RICCO|nr:conserved hypothetical protein [Ricinus communis]